MIRHNISEERSCFLGIFGFKKTVLYGREKRTTTKNEESRIQAQGMAFCKSERLYKTRQNKKQRYKKRTKDFLFELKNRKNRWREHLRTHEKRIMPE